MTFWVRRGLQLGTGKITERNNMRGKNPPKEHRDTITNKRRNENIEPTVPPYICSYSSLNIVHYKLIYFQIFTPQNWSHLLNCTVD